MEIWEYVYNEGIWFWQTSWVSLLLGLSEGILFLWYAQPEESSKRDPRLRMAARGVFLALYCLVELLHFPVAIHCVILLGLFFLLLRCVSSKAWENACFESSIFCQMMEFCKLVCRDGLLAGLLFRAAPGLPEAVFYVLLMVFYLILLYLGVFLLKKFVLRQMTLQMTWRQALSLMFPILVFLFVRQVQFSYLNTGNSVLWLQMETILAAVTICTVIVIATMGSMLSVQLERNELLEKEMLLQEKQRQYLVQKETIETVNRKYHDLKHYLTALERLGSGELKECVQAMEHEIEPYEHIQETGNEILDILLTERIRECQAKGIRLVPFVDGKCFGFIQSLDLCAIFGNAMDNAVEATEKLRYVNMKEINIKIGTSDEFAVMRFHNYFEGELKKKGDRILSGKLDSREHGYGLENIRSLTEKYGGTMSYETSGQEFELHIVIPLPRSGSCRPAGSQQGG